MKKERKFQIQNKIMHLNNRKTQFKKKKVKTGKIKPQRINENFSFEVMPVNANQFYYMNKKLFLDFNILKFYHFLVIFI